MAAIAHSFSEQGTRQTVTGVTYTAVLTHASSNFVAGAKYRIRVTAGIDSANTTNLVKARVVHGSTEFAGSEYIKDVLEAGATRPYSYIWQTVWTAVSGEAVALQIASDAAGIVVGADQIQITVMRLDADLVENTDWFFAQYGGDPTTLTLAGVDGASIMFTPPAGTDWCVETSARHDVGSTARSYGSRIVSSGTFNESVPTGFREGENLSEFLLMSQIRVFTALAASSQTFKEQSFNTQSAGDTRTHSSIFAFNLNKFKEHVSAWTVAAEVLGTTDWADPYQVGVSLTPSVAGDVWIIAQALFDCGNALREVAQRLQIDNVDSFGVWSATDYFESSNDATDETPFGTQTVENLSAAAHTFDHEGDCSSVTGAPEVQHRSLCAFTFELAAAAAVLPGPLHVIYQQSNHRALSW